jgi:hypothetical protein
MVEFGACPPVPPLYVRQKSAYTRINNQTKMTYKSKSARTLTATLFTIGSLVVGANAAVTITISEDGPDVRVRAAGTLNTTGLSFLTNITQSANLAVTPLSGTIVLGGTPNVSENSPRSIYENANPVTVFGSGAGMASFTGLSGDVFGFESTSPSTSFLFVPIGFVSGSSITSEGFFSGASFTTLGVLPGSYAYSLPNDTVNIVIVPEPASSMLAGLGAMCLLVRRRK